MRTPKKPPHIALTAIFAVVVFAIITVTMMILGFAVWVLENLGVLDLSEHSGFSILSTGLAISSILVGTVVAIMVSKIPLNPINKLISGMNNLAAGNYDTRISFGKFRPAKDLEDSFNTLAEELQNTEMIRSDFVNNFSHEFKTPLVSIKGFARLLEKGNLPEEKQKRYLGIIVSESTRLADMATKVLDLTKVENQAILTDVEEFNLSEQLRESILILEKKWEAKQLCFDANFEEYDIVGNKEMLKQVWLNLLDNAIKLSEDNGVVSVRISKTPDNTVVSVSNVGEPIADSEKQRIFQKFYQSDTSHTSSGNGIGLAIVKRITELHRGTVTVNCSGGETTFSVLLPNEQ